VPLQKLCHDLFFLHLLLVPSSTPTGFVWRQGAVFLFLSEASALYIPHHFLSQEMQDQEH